MHGSEASGSEVAMKVAYTLAGARDRKTELLLKHAVVIIDPMLNPDGRDRYVNWFNSVVGDSANSNPESVEHHPPWPGGRFNHYLFDLNRDWAWGTQPETQARVRLFRRWMPEVHVDFHEMNYNSTYFFFPSTRPRNPDIPPSLFRWAAVFGRENARAFDRHDYLYYTKEGFDLYYPGYGDSWPSFNGAVGMTYEQAGGGGSGVLVRQTDGSLLSLRDRIARHTLSSFTTIQTAVKYRKKLLRDFYTFWEKSLARAKQSGLKAVIISPTQDLQKLSDFVALLERQGIEVKRARADFRLKNVHPYGSHRKVRRKFQAGSLIIDMQQPHYYLAKALLSPEIPAPDTLYFYDIVSWSLPFAFQLPAAWTENEPEVSAGKITAAEILQNKEKFPFEKGKAYLIPWDNLASVNVLSRIFQKNLKVRVATKPFTLQTNLGKRAFKRGTLIVLRGDNSGDKSFFKKVKDCLTGTPAPFFIAQTALAEKGFDLGSPHKKLLKKPKIAVVRGAPVVPTALGAVRYWVEQRAHFPVTDISIGQVKSGHLKDFNVLILPDDYGKGYSAKIDSASAGKLKDWIKNGGTLIGIDGGAEFASGSQCKLASIKIRVEKKEKDETQKSFRFRTLEEKEKSQWENRIPGTILKVTLDTTHPLGFGYSGLAYVLKTNKLFLVPSQSGNNVGVYLPGAKVSGFLSKKNETRLMKSVFLYEERVGKGHIILFASDPLFRGFWEGPVKLFFNAVFIEPGM